MIEVIRHFLPSLLAGFLVNLTVAAGAVALGLAVGVPLALLRWLAPRSSRIVWPGVRLMQAAPTYVVMFFVLSLLPRDWVLFGLVPTGLAAVILAQSVYMTSYVADNCYRAIEHVARRERDLALLFLPNLLRGWLLVVMSSGFGAAIGVQEAVGVTMRQAEQLHEATDRVVLFLVVIALFVLVFGTANAVIQRLMRWMAAAGTRPEPGGRGPQQA